MSALSIPSFSDHFNSRPHGGRRDPDALTGY